MSGGRPRKPVEEHVRNGTYRADRHGPLPDGMGKPISLHRLKIAPRLAAGVKCRGCACVFFPRSLHVKFCSPMCKVFAYRTKIALMKLEPIAQTLAEKCGEPNRHCSA